MKESPTEATDAELLARVARGDHDPARSRDAQAQFYERHVRYLYGALRKRRQLLELAGESAEDLVQETFQRAFERAQTFRGAPELDTDRQRQRTRAWLGRVAHSLLVDKLRDEPARADSPYLERLGVDDDDSGGAVTPALERVVQALGSMSEREQDILRVTALYYRAGHESQRLPNRVSEELAQRWQTTNDNIRAIRSRALKRLKALVMAPGLSPMEDA